MKKVKGCYQFINGISYLDEQTKKKINIIMVGTGSEEKKILELVEKKIKKFFFFTLKTYLIKTFSYIIIFPIFMFL